MTLRSNNGALRERFLTEAFFSKYALGPNCRPKGEADVYKKYTNEGEETQASPCKTRERNSGPATGIKGQSRLGVLALQASS